LTGHGPQLMAGRLLRRIPALTEADPAEPAAAPPRDGPATGRRRLTPFGQALLATGLVLTGLLIYSGSWEISRRMTNRGEICLKLRPAQAAAAAAPEGNRLLRQYRVGMTLIQGLSVATPGQRLRLAEQLNGLVRELDSLCRLSTFFTNEEAALLNLATACATVIVVCLVLLAPQGLQTVSRSQRTVFFTAGAILGLVINLLQLGEQQTNSTLAWQIYRGHDALLQHLSSSLANRRLEPGLSPGTGPEPLASPEAVARLISSIDSQRLAMPDPRLKFNSSVAQSAWGRLLGGGADRRGDSSPPAGGPPGGSGWAPAAAPSPPSPPR
jgi:hypothetical protein